MVLRGKRRVTVTVYRTGDGKWIDETTATFMQTSQTKKFSIIIIAAYSRICTSSTTPTASRILILSIRHIRGSQKSYSGRYSSAQKYLDPADPEYFFSLSLKSHIRVTWHRIHFSVPSSSLVIILTSWLTNFSRNTDSDIPNSAVYFPHISRHWSSVYH